MACDSAFDRPPLHGRLQDAWARPLFSPRVVTAEAVPALVDAQLHPDELAAVERAVPKRRAEFGTARLCARRALSSLGFEPAALLPHEGREPRWPPGAVGSTRPGARAVDDGTFDRAEVCP